MTVFDPKLRRRKSSISGWLLWRKNQHRTCHPDGVNPLWQFTILKFLARVVSRTSWNANPFFKNGLRFRCHFGDRQIAGIPSHCSRPKARSYRKLSMSIPAIVFQWTWVTQWTQGECKALQKVKFSLTDWHSSRWILATQPIGGLGSSIIHGSKHWKMLYMRNGE